MLNEWHAIRQDIDLDLYGFSIGANGFGGEGRAHGHFDFRLCAAQQFLRVCFEEYNLKWDWMVPCHFTPECSNEAEQRKEILWWPLASLHHCRSCLCWCKDQLTPGGQQKKRRMRKGSASKRGNCSRHYPCLLFPFFNGITHDAFF